MKNIHLYILAFFILFFAATNSGLAQIGVIRPSVITNFGGQVGSALAQHVLRGDIRLASDVFLSEERTYSGNYELSISTTSRLIAVIPHSVSRRSRGVSVMRATNAIFEQLIRRRLAVRRN